MQFMLVEINFSPSPLLSPNSGCASLLTIIIVLRTKHYMLVKTVLSFKMQISVACVTKHRTRQTQPRAQPVR